MDHIRVMVRRVVLGAAVCGLVGVAVVGCGASDTSAEVSETPVVVETSDDDGTDDDAAAGEDDSGDVDAQSGTVTRGNEIRLTDASVATVMCDGGGEVYVQHTGAVAITGTCDDVDIDASGADVTLESASDVDIEASDTTVVATQIGELDIGGNGNTVTVDSVRDIDIEGSNNTVTHGNTPNEVDDEGSGNQVRQG